ncbi:MAG TPA: hypothetical protein VF881_21450 [Polyangiaceae bacterium]
MKHGPSLFALSLAAAFLPSRVIAQNQGESQPQVEKSPQQVSTLERNVAAPSRALELQVATGYNQGVGALGSASGAHVQDVAGVGIGAELGAGYRIVPRLFIGAYGTAALFTPLASESGVKAFAGGIQAQWHFRAYRAVDPWAALGTGYRLFWESPPNESRNIHRAFDAVRFALGVDYRLNPEFAIGPMVAANLALFSPETSTSGTAISTFLSVGVAARFDMFGQPVHPVLDTASR